MSRSAPHRRPRLALLAAAAALAALVAAIATRAPNAPPAAPTAHAVVDAPAELGLPAAVPVEERARDAQQRKLEELHALSETFRNTTFLIAIRDAGFMCHEPVSVYGGRNGSTTWTATCGDMLAYSVRVDGTGALDVEPTVHYFDAPLRAPIEAPRE